MRKHVASWLIAFLFIHPFLIGCVNDSKKESISLLRPECVVEAIMDTYPTQLKEGELPRPRIGPYPFTVKAIYKNDSFRIVSYDLWDLVRIAETNNHPTDSMAIASLVKGKSEFILDNVSITNVTIVEPSVMIDSIRAKGKDFTISHFFGENGWQKIPINKKDMAYLIDVLLDWNILLSFDDVGGFYRVNQRCIGSL